LRVEFLGLPGAGKTTIRRALLERLKNKNAEKYITSEEACYKRIKLDGDKVYRYLLGVLPYKTGLEFSGWMHGRSLFQLEAQNSFLARYGKALNAFISSIVYEKMSLEDKKNVMGSFLGTGSVWDLLNAPLFVNSIIFFEEGFVQKSFMFVDHNYNSGMINLNLREYFQNIPLPDVVIHVRTDISLSHRRMLERKDGLTNRLKGLDEISIDKFLNSAEGHVDNIRKELSGKTDCKVIDIVNEGPLEEVIESLLKKLQPYI